MKEPRALEHEEIVLAGMMNDNECYYDGIAELSDSFFADYNTINLFNKMVEASSRLSSSMIASSFKEPKQKAHVQTVDLQWSNKDEFYYSLDQLKETYLKRELYHALNKAGSSFNESTFGEIVGTLDQDINKVNFDDVGQNIIDPVERGAIAYQEFLELLDNPDLAKGIPYSYTSERGVTTGFPSLDRALNGAHPGDLIMIAAKTGEGKTGFAINLARNFSFTNQYRGYYMNTEMRLVEMEARLLGALAGVKANEILYANIEGSADEIKAKKDRISDAYSMFMRSKLIMSRIPDLPLHKAKGLAKQVKSRYETLDYIIVDYVGRMDVAGFGGSPWDELYEITKQLKELAMILEIPIFILAQRNQAGDVEGAKKMMNECDGVLFFEPTTDEDTKYIDEQILSSKARLVNYKLEKRKVRRDDNPAPIYVYYNKAMNVINEVTD